VLRIAAGLERASGHPIARAIRAEAARRGVAMPEALDLVERPGSGISGVIDGVRWTLRAGAAGEVELCCDADPAQDKGGRIGLRDVIRDDAARTVAALKAAGYRVVLVSGDHPEVVQRIAAEAGITEVLAGATPEAKAAWVRAQDGGVLFVGDGVNDGPALAAATVGVAMGTGVASTVTVADAVVARDGLGPVAAGLRAARAAKRAIRGNASRSLVYNALAVTAAVAGWVNPLIAAVLMPLSSAMVAWGAARVEKWTR
jgi:cation transport ATPase